jgi:hypothetical protein
MTFQRFNGDSLNQGLKWTEGLPIGYQPFTGNLVTPHHPMTSLAYFRLYWKYLEPEEGQYDWEQIDKALKTAGERGQTLLFRLAPYGTGPKKDIPDWYRAKVGPETELKDKQRADSELPKWQTNPEDPRYAHYFGRMVRAMGKRYDNHPLLESVDVSFIGPWGEGAGSEQLSNKTREALIDAYMEGFPHTNLLMLLIGPKTCKYGLSRRPNGGLGWRQDCLGDMGGFSGDWNHMLDIYPEKIIQSGMKDAWKTGPVSFEVCWVMQKWKNEGWDIDYIIEQSLKWHISSFNAKSSAVPEAWKPNVDRWLNRMGYRLALRRLNFVEKVVPGGPLRFESWWENQGVAPPYHPFRFAFRLKHGGYSAVLPTSADLRTWLPGDTVQNGSVMIPREAPLGDYEVQIGVLGKSGDEPKVRLAIAGREADGWYPMGKTSMVARMVSR